MGGADFTLNKVFPLIVQMISAFIIHNDLNINPKTMIEHNSFDSLSLSLSPHPSLSLPLSPSLYLSLPSYHLVEESQSYGEGLCESGKGGRTTRVHDREN